MRPKISVLMGIFNCASTLEQAVLAIQNQTYDNWELILCDDGSSDNTYEVAQALAAKDSRIVLLRNVKNLGLNQTLNNCLVVATGDYIARMDGDDGRNVNITRVFLLIYFPLIAWQKED